MKIAANTKISALIKANPASIEAIASINKHFEKLRNPVLRKLLASRVTIADAARIGGCEIERFYERLAPLGFNANDKDTAASGALNVNYQIAMPDQLVKLIPNYLSTLDVREDIAADRDPFRKIMQAIDGLVKKEALLIINTFEPTPLIAILKKKGFDSFVEVKSADLIYSYFWVSEVAPENEVRKEAAAADPFDELLIRFAGKVKKTDVRHLEMPQPMITILQELEHLPAGIALFVNHKRVPQYLLPQIEERGFTIAIQEKGPADVHLLIYKK